MLPTEAGNRLRIQICDGDLVPIVLIGAEGVRQELMLIKSVFYVPGGADDNLIEGGEMKFVCKPGARNITVIFQPLLRYGHNVEHLSKRIAR